MRYTMKKAVKCIRCKGKGYDLFPEEKCKLCKGRGARIVDVPFPKKDYGIKPTDSINDVIGKLYG